MKETPSSFRRYVVRYLNLLIRPFIDFYFNYGLARASVLSYVLCANLIIFVYLFMTIGVTITIDPLVSPSSTRRFLELHFLWPATEKMLLEKLPENFGINEGNLVTIERYQEALQEYCKKNNTTQAILIEEERLKVNRFSITAALGSTIHEAVRTFYDAKNKTKINPLGAGFFIALGIAYFALILSIKTNLAESVSPIVWGNIPIASRRSEIMKILWKIPNPGVIKSRAYLFFMLPILVTMTITVLSAGHKLVDILWEPYSFGNIIVIAIFSLLITALLFMSLYELHVSGISKKNAAIGALIAAALWLGGRWFFTTYGALSLYRNLRNFAFIPIFLTWFYYFCTVFLFGLYVAQTLQDPNLSMTARAWAMRDIAFNNRYNFASTWVRLDFLYRLALSRYEEYRPPFLGIKVEEDCAAEIAKKSNLAPSFVRECILEMIVNHRRFFHIEVEGNRQYCKLKVPAEEVDVIPLLIDPQDAQNMIEEEMPGYTFGNYILQSYGTLWNVKPLLLCEVYHNYKKFEEQKKQKI